MAARLAASFPADSALPSAMSTSLAEVRDVAVLLYVRELLVHCLLYYARGYGTTSTQIGTLQRSLPHVSLAQQMLAEAGAPAAGVGAHSFAQQGCLAAA